MFDFMFISLVTSELTSFKIGLKESNELDFLRNFQLGSSKTFHKVKELKGLYKPYESPMEERAFLPQAVGILP